MVDTRDEGRVSVLDVPVIREFLDVVPKDLLGMPPMRHMEFRIDLTPGAASIFKVPYHFVAPEMHELSTELKSC